MTLFLIQPFASHYYPNFGLAHKIVSQGERVVFTTRPFHNEIVLTEGFEYQEFEYLTEYKIRNIRSFFGLLLKSLISKEYFSERLGEFEKGFYLTKKLIQKYNPSHVYIDQSLAEYYFFFKPYVPNIIIVHTKFYSGKLRGIPPMNSAFIPKNNLYSYFVSELLWLKALRKQRFQELIQKIAFLGKDEKYLWIRHCKNHGMNWGRQIDFKHSLNRGIKNVKSLVLAPRELEFPTFKAPENLKFYDGASLKNEAKYFSKDYVTLKNKLSENKIQNIVYLAFGTLASNNVKIEKFFNDVLIVAEEFNDLFLIISRGNVNMNLITTANSLAFNFLPQQDILTYANLFITHGGLGSIKEAYYAGVPMLVAPLNTKVDQSGNAARVQAKGLGKLLNLNNYTKSELKEKIKSLIKIKDFKTIGDFELNSIKQFP